MEFKIKELRCKKGMSQRELADEAGVCLHTVLRIEDGFAKDCRISSVLAVADALECKIDDLIVKEGEEMGIVKLDRQEAIRMRDEGKTYQEIADRFGCSKQYVATVLARRMGEDSLFKKIPYKGLREYFQENRKTTVPLFCKKCFGQMKHAFVTKFIRLLHGDDVHLTINQIKKLSTFTGMTFEELFEVDNV